MAKTKVDLTSRFLSDFANTKLLIHHAIGAALVSVLIRLLLDFNALAIDRTTL